MFKSTRNMWLGVLSLWLSISPFAHSDSAQTIRFYKQDSAPKYFSADAPKAGLCGEIYLALQQRLDAQGLASTIDNTLYPIKRILHMVDTNGRGVFCGAGRNAKREQLFHYSSIPAYSVANVVVAHRDDSKDPASFAELAAAQQMIGARFGSSSTRFLQKQPGLVVSDQFETVQQGLKLVASGRRIRWFFYHDLGLYHALNQSDLPLRIVPTQFRTYSHWLLYSRGMPENLRHTLDQALESMAQSGELAKIEKRYKTLD